MIKNDEESKLTEYVGGMVYEGEQLKFIQHEEGRVVCNSGEEYKFEYQYNLKDHLGNVRLSITSQEKTDTFLATMESSRESREKAEFLHYEESTKINAELFDHTNQGGTYFSHRLSGVAKERIGLAKSLAVMPGDVVSAEVYAKYTDPDIDNWDSNLAALMASIASGSSTVIVDGIGINLEENSMAGLLGKDAPEGIQAYLNIVIVDENFQFVDAGYEPVRVEAKEDGSAVAHQHLRTKEYAIEKPGYVYIFLSNENETPVDVFFDDFTVTHQHSLVVQTDDYYPFGLTHEGSSYQKESSIKNKYLYNGKELQEDLGLDMYDYGARFYDAAIGKFGAVDPKSESIHNWSLNPYHYTNNNPILYVDFNGEDWFVSNGNGVLVNIKGVSEFNYSNLKKEYGNEIATFLYNLGGSAGSDSWEHFGADDMFDSEDSKVSEGLNGLTMMSVESSEAFMNSHGYRKSTKYSVKEITVEINTWVDFEEKIYQKNTHAEARHNGTTYKKPNEFYHEQGEEKFRSESPWRASVETRIFDVYMPYKENYIKRKEAGSNAAMNLINIILNAAAELGGKKMAK